MESALADQRQQDSDLTENKPTPSSKRPLISPDSAVRCGWCHLRIWPILLVGLFADLYTKAWVIVRLGLPIRQLDPEVPEIEQIAPLYQWAVQRFGDCNDLFQKEYVIIPDFFRFLTVFNPGASWGIAAGKTGWLLTGSFVALLFMMWLLTSLEKQQWVAQIAVGMLFAGALGNTHDRMFNLGNVVDFIDVDLHFPPANPWPAFNIADSLLCVGVATLLICMFFGNRKRDKKTA
jgi:signal peptidase II